MDSEGKFSGDNIAYIYQDLTTALLGKFKDGLMQAAREVEVTSWRCQGGIARLKFSEPKGPVYRYDPPSRNSFGHQPSLMDPLDKK